MSYSEPEDRSLAYASLSTASLSVPASAKTGRLQMLGASIVQRRVRLATAPATELTEMNATGVGLKALGVRSRTGTSPLVELQHQGEFLTKSTSFQTMPPPGIRFIDETKIEEHRVRTQTLEPRPQRRVNTGRQQFGQRLMDTGKGLFTGTRHDLLGRLANLSDCRALLGPHAGLHPGGCLLGLGALLRHHLDLYQSCCMKRACTLCRAPRVRRLFQVQDGGCGIGAGDLQQGRSEHLEERRQCCGLCHCVPSLRGGHQQLFLRSGRRRVHADPCQLVLLHCD